MAAFMTTDEVAELFRVDVETVRRWRRSRKLQGTQIGHRWLFERGYIDNVVIKRGAGADDFGADFRRRLGRRP